MIISISKIDKSIVLSVAIAKEIMCADTADAQSYSCMTRVSPVTPKVEVYLHYADTRPIGIDDASSIPPGLCLLATKAGRYEVALAGAQVWVPRSEFSTGQSSVQPISTRPYAPAAGPSATNTPTGSAPAGTQPGAIGAGTYQLAAKYAAAGYAYAGTNAQGEMLVADRAGTLYVVDKKGHLHRTRISKPNGAPEKAGGKPAMQKLPEAYRFTSPPSNHFMSPMVGAGRFIR
jgi:hypothetical protein